MADDSGWANRFQGLGAYWGGNGPAWEVAQVAERKRNDELDEARKKALFQDFRTIRMQLEDGDTAGAMGLLQNRLEAISKLGGDPMHTAEVGRLMSEGKTDEAISRLKKVEEIGVANEMLPSMAPEYSDIKTGADGKQYGMRNGRYELIESPEGVSFAPSGGSADSLKYQFGPGGVFKGPDGIFYQSTQKRNPLTGEVETVTSPMPEGYQMVGAMGLTADEQVSQKREEAAASKTGQLQAELKLAPQVQSEITKAVEGVKQQVQAAGKARDNVAVFDAYETAMRNLSSALGGTATGPILGLIPAITSNAQSAEAAGKILGVAIKGLVRGAGEGVWTDNDQKQVNDMLPKRTDTPEARALKIQFIDSYVRAKFGMGQSSNTAQPDPVQSANSDIPVAGNEPPRSGGQLMVDAQGNKAMVYRDGRIEEVQ